MAFNQYAKTERDFTTLLNSANMSPADRDRLSAILASLVGFQSTQPGTNEAIEEQIASIDEQIGDILAAISNIKVPVWKMQVFEAGGSFVVPDSIAGTVVYVTGSGGGGSGGAYISPSQQTLGGACSGCYMERVPYTVSAGDSISVTVGAGGNSVSVSGTSVINLGNYGGSSFFGSIEFFGGSPAAASAPSVPQVGGWLGGYFQHNGGGVTVPAENSHRFKASPAIIESSNIVMGSAGGAFGNGGNPDCKVNANSTAQSALPNTGAAGGSAFTRSADGNPYVATSGAGGSGKIIVEWQEFV